jgi:O-antigen ligase
MFGGEIMTFLLGAGTVLAIFAWRYEIIEPARRSAMFILSMLGFVVWLAFTLTYTAALDAGIGKSIRFILLTTPAAILPILLLPTLDSTKRFLYAWVTAAIFYTFESYQTSETFRAWETWSAFGAYYVTAGRICGMGVLSSLLLLLIMRRSLYAFILIVAAFISFVGLINTGARGPLVCLFFSVLISAWVVRRFVRGKHILSALTMFGFAVVVIITGNSFVSQTGQERMVSFLGKTTSDPAANSRYRLYKGAIEIIAEHPLGTGIGSYGRMAKLKADDLGTVAQYPHNMVLEILSELGWPGLLFFCAILCNVVFALIGRRRAKSLYHSWPTVCAVALFLFWFGNAQLSGDLNNNRRCFAIFGSVIALRSLSDSLGKRPDVQ